MRQVAILVKFFIFVTLIGACFNPIYAESLGDCFANPDDCLSLSVESNDDFQSSATKIGSDSGGFTIKSGHVLSDGQRHKHASPKMLAALKEKALKDDEPAGLVNNQLYMIANDDFIFIPVVELAGKSKDQIRTRIMAEVVSKVVVDETMIEIDVETLSEELDRNEGDVQAAIREAIENSFAETILPAQAADALNAVKNNIDGVAASSSNTQTSRLAESSTKAANIQSKNIPSQISSTGFRSVQSVTSQVEQASEQIAQSNAVKQAQTKAVSLATRVQSMGSLRSKINDIVNVAVKATESSAAEINQAISAWDSMSDGQKQAMVDKANREGLYGCKGSCTVQDAENMADSNR